jgi:hypothetical protein
MLIVNCLFATEAPEQQRGNRSVVDDGALMTMGMGMDPGG